MKVAKKIILGILLIAVVFVFTVAAVMYRGYVTGEGKIYVAIYKEEPKRMR